MSESLANLQKEGLEKYSTSERIVGTWIDGKPIYEVVIEDTAPTVSTEGTEVSKGYTIPTATKIIEMSGVVMALGDDYQHIISGRNSGSYKGIQMGYQLSSNKVFIWTNTTWAGGRPFRIIVRYTKS